VLTFGKLYDLRTPRGKERSAVKKSTLLGILLGILLGGSLGCSEAPPRETVAQPSPNMTMKLSPQKVKYKPVRPQDVN